MRTALTAVLAGFLPIWAPVLAYYAAHGQLGGFLGAYLMFPEAVAAGINDTPWQGLKHTPSPLTPMYLHLPFLLAVLALLPAKARTWVSVRTAAETPYFDRHQQGASPGSATPVTPATLAAQRVGPGLVYFTADLNPVPIGTFEYDGSTLTEPQLKA